jgi:hypothetical protein
MKWKWRLFWLGGLLLLWLFCSGVAAADLLLERIHAYPHWQTKPSLQPVGTEDLVYPAWFAGDWTVKTTLLEQLAPLAPDIVTPGFDSNGTLLNQPIQFRVRFVDQPSTGLLRRLQSAPPLVSDRAYNGKQLTTAYLGDRAVLAVKVDPKNPNRQITLLRSDKQIVSTVTARSTETLAPDEFLTSEFFRQEFRGIPQPYFNEVENTTLYHHYTGDSADQAESSAAEIVAEIVADQITAIYLSPQDPNYFQTLSGENPLSSPRPVALYRYRMEFFR